MPGDTQEALRYTIRSRYLMKKLLTVSKGEHFAGRIRTTLGFLLITLGLVTAFWVATMPVAEAQEMSPTRMIEANLPQGQTMRTASKQSLANAVCAAINKNRRNAAQIVRAAIEARKQWSNDILRAAFNCVGTTRANCELLGDIYRAFIVAYPDEANDATELALQLAPECASSFQARGDRPSDVDEGNFDNVPGNQNPPPGSIGAGGGSQSGRCQVCHRDGQGRRRTLTISCNALPAHISHGDTEGACPVTPTQNP